MQAWGHPLRVFHLTSQDTGLMCSLNGGTGGGNGRSASATGWLRTTESCGWMLRDQPNYIGSTWTLAQNAEFFRSCARR